VSKIVVLYWVKHSGGTNEQRCRWEEGFTRSILLEVLIVVQKFCFTAPFLDIEMLISMGNRLHINRMHTLVPAVRLEECSFRPVALRVTDGQKF
jgi:hypothetical protein